MVQQGHFRDLAYQRSSKFSTVPMGSLSHHYMICSSSKAAGGNMTSVVATRNCPLVATHTLVLPVIIT
jgi:hypothetical protein